MPAMPAIPAEGVAGRGRDDAVPDHRRQREKIPLAAHALSNKERRCNQTGLPGQRVHAALAALARAAVAAGSSGADNE